MSTVRYRQGTLPPLTKERQAELQALSERPDTDIDFSDIPPLDKKSWNTRYPVDSLNHNRFTPQCAVMRM